MIKSSLAAIYFFILTVHLSAQVTEIDTPLKLSDVDIDPTATQILGIDSEGLVTRRHVENVGVPVNTIIAAECSDRDDILAHDYSFYGTIVPEGALAPPPGMTYGEWQEMSFIITHQPRTEHTASWTTGKMLIYGGFGVDEHSLGLLYNQSMDSWITIETTDGPGLRHSHIAFTNGGAVYIHGGVSSGMTVNDLYKYNVSTNTWTQLSSSPGGGRSSHTAVRTNDGKIIIWGGFAPGSGATKLNTGAIYDIDTDSWLGIPPAPVIGRVDHKAVWSEIDERMYVFGGRDDIGYDGTVLRYDPVSEIWDLISAPPAFEGRVGHTLVVHGINMYIYGGVNDVSTFDGGWRYDPTSGTLPWSELTDVNGPGHRRDHTATVIGDEMIIWGGHNDSSVPAGKKYNVSLSEWQDVSSILEPTPRTRHTAVSTGSSMIVWGGWDITTIRNNGGIYDPSIEGVGDIGVVPLCLFKKL